MMPFRRVKNTIFGMLFVLSVLNLNPKPYTLNSRPYMLSPAPYTLYHAPYTLHRAPCTLNPPQTRS